MAQTVCALLHSGQVHSCKLIANVPRARMHAMDPDQEAARRFLREIERVTGWSLSKLAKAAGVSHTTFTRLFDEEATHTLSARTLSKLRKGVASEIDPMQFDSLWLMTHRQPASDARSGRNT